MNCPECGNVMNWLNDQNSDNDDYFESYYDCKQCDIDLIKKVDSCELRKK